MTHDTQSDDEYKLCGTVRPGTLGYQQCVRPKGHDGPHRSQDRKEWD